MEIDKEIFLKYLNSFHERNNDGTVIIDCEIIEVWEVGRKDIIFRCQYENAEMIGQYATKIDKYKKFARNYKIVELTK